MCSLHSDRHPVIRHSKSRRVSEDLICGHWRSAISNFASRIHLAQFPGRHLDTKIEAQIQDASISAEPRTKTTFPDNTAIHRNQDLCKALLRSPDPCTHSGHQSTFWHLKPRKVLGERRFANYRLNALELRLPSWVCTCSERDPDAKIDANRLGCNSKQEIEMQASRHVDFRPLSSLSLHVPGGAARTKVLDQITLHPCF